MAEAHRRLDGRRCLRRVGRDGRRGTRAIGWMQDRGQLGGGIDVILLASAESVGGGRRTGLRVTADVTGNSKDKDTPAYQIETRMNVAILFLFFYVFRCLVVSRFLFLYFCFTAARRMLF